MLRVVADAPRAAFVGGWVRDVLLGRPSDDLDIVAGDPDGLVDLLRKAGGRSTVLLDPVRRTWRVGFGRAWLDVTALRGQTLEEDLRARDLRCNAMAWTPNLGLVDPLGGRDDLRNGRLRLAGPGALRDDPLRALRVWRFAVQLGADLAFDVAGADLSGVAHERIGTELSKILAHSDSVRALAALHEAGLLAALLPGEEPRLALHARGMAETRSGPALDRCWAQVGDRAVAVALGWLCDDPELDGSLHARRWPNPISRGAAATSRATTEEFESIGSDLVRWRGQAAFALLGRAAVAADPEACVAPYLRALDEAPGHRNPKGLPVPPLPVALVPAADVRELLELPPGPALGRAVDSLVEAQLDGRVTSDEQARAFVRGQA